ncbi:uncharacterized protein LOC142817398 [Rhipicephalus microplus]|uniref:uncharacterized protein LOC142817398 n=1 Tax=Rhipicephalus microplus TaxID=6941 RepID=UPI003F6D6BEB
MLALGGGAADHLVPCTASEKQTCQIVTKLVTWNRLLRGSGLEIQEQPETSDQLHIMNFPFSSTWGSIKLWKLPNQAELLEWLLSTHKCIGSVSLDLSLGHDTSTRVLRAISEKKGVKTMKLSSMEASAARTISATLPCLTEIVTLHLTCFPCLLDGFIDPLCRLLQASSSLRCLHLSGTLVQETAVDMFFTAISRGSALKGLHLQSLLIKSGARPQALKEYLSSTTALNVLAVTVMNLFMQRAILEGILKNRSIRKLSLHGFLEDEQSVALMSRIIRENLVIRVLHVETARKRGPLVLNPVYGCWVTPLIENNALKEVSLSSSILHPTMWSDFFRALPTKKTLKVVRICLLSLYSNLQWLCAELKCSGCERKVSLGHHQFTGQIDLIDCEAFSGTDLLVNVTDGDKLAILHRLPSYEHIKYISIWIYSDYMHQSLALAEYLRSTRTLHVLKLSVIGAVLGETDVQQQWWTIILESLSENKSVTELEVRMFDMSIRDTEDLADLLKRNTSIRCFLLNTESPVNFTDFFRCLSVGIQDNYNLMRVNDHGPLESDALSPWLAVREATMRNSGLVARAARMKEASPLDRYVTAALERVVLHPTLLDEVARVIQVDKAELAVLARGRLRRTQCLDGFMQVVGVVKDRVVCHPVDDDRLQLDDLNEDCWRHVRQYLSTADVKCAAANVNNV